MRRKKPQEIDDIMSKYKKYCKHCGHSVIFEQKTKGNRTICTHCGHWIYKNDKEEFKDRLLVNILRSC